MEPRLQAIAKQNVIFAINNITQSVLRDLEYDPGTLIHIDKQEDGTISSIQYDSYQLNQILFTALNTIDQSLADSEGEQLQDGEEIYFKNGAVFECPIGYLTKIPFLSNSGPRIPIRLKLLNDITGEIKVDSTPYGVNSTLIRAYMKISVKTQVITIGNGNNDRDSHHCAGCQRSSTRHCALCLRINGILSMDDFTLTKNISLYPLKTMVKYCMIKTNIRNYKTGV
jgi:hypothetical protein